MTEAVRQACNKLVELGEAVKDDSNYGHTRYALKEAIEPPPVQEKRPLSWDAAAGIVDSPGETASTPMG